MAARHASLKGIAAGQGYALDLLLRDAKRRKSRRYATQWSKKRGRPQDKGSRSLNTSIFLQRFLFLSPSCGNGAKLIVVVKISETPLMTTPQVICLDPKR